MEYVYREPGRTEIFPIAGDLKPRAPGSKPGAKRRPKPLTAPSRIMAVGILVETSKFTGSDLRTIRAKNGVGRPPRQRLERLAARASSF